jgi:hypothetical protein
VSETVHIGGLSDAKGYKRESFKEGWAAYLPVQNLGQNTSSPPFRHSDPSNRPNATGTGASGVFSSVRKASLDGSKNDDLAYCRNGLDAWTDRKSESDAQEDLTTNLAVSGTDAAEMESAESAERWPRVCEHCGAPERPDAQVQTYSINDRECLLHPHCQKDWLDGPDPDGWTFNLE